MTRRGMDKVHVQGFVGKVAATAPAFVDFHSARVLLRVRIMIEVVARVDSNLLGVESVELVCNGALREFGEQPPLRMTRFLRPSNHMGETV